MTKWHFSLQRYSSRWQYLFDQSPLLLLAHLISSCQVSLILSLRFLIMLFIPLHHWEWPTEIRKWLKPCSYIAFYSWKNNSKRWVLLKLLIGICSGEKTMVAPLRRMNYSSDRAHVFWVIHHFTSSWNQSGQTSEYRPLNQRRIVSCKVIYTIRCTYWQHAKMLVLLPKDRIMHFDITSRNGNTIISLN